MDLLNTDLEILFIFGGFLLIAIVMVLIAQWRIEQKNEEIRENVFRKKLIHFEEFEKNWIVHKQGNKGISGYKYNDTSGCYVIFIYNDYTNKENYRNYEEIYIGQSINICQRVHNHFNGKGNGDVYADIKYGKEVYVQFIPCAKYSMNDTEKELIKAFNATNSYNFTQGGSKYR